MQQEVRPHRQLQQENLYGKYEMIEGTEENFKEVAEKAPEVVEKIVAINEGTATLETAAEQAEQLKEELTGKVLVTNSSM